jgi:hypothetical protein
LAGEPRRVRCIGPRHDVGEPAEDGRIRERLQVQAVIVDRRRRSLPGDLRDVVAEADMARAEVVDGSVAQLKRRDRLLQRIRLRCACHDGEPVPQWILRHWRSPNGWSPVRASFPEEPGAQASRIPPRVVAASRGADTARRRAARCVFRNDVLHSLREVAESCARRDSNLGR